ncbi:MAG: undecaprenyl-diphosphate phosphatase [Lachnospiraceae bacterium]|nr:undecaprenyl-diphosphate phosphatase [Lachnospiraceae bacterium]
MNLFEAIIMGLIQGLTEFLPVSSSGHLAIASNLFGLNTPGVLFETLLHLGTLVAVIIIFWHDFKNLVINGIALIIDVIKNIITWFRNKFGKKDLPYKRLITSAYRKFAALIIITSIPTAIIAVILNRVITNASSTLFIPGICLIITAIMLIFLDGKQGGAKKVRASTWKDAAIVGVAQGVATLPGISRSGATIAAGLFRGYNKAYALKYSFLASIPAIVGANIFELRHVGGEVVSGGLVGKYIVGMIIAGVVGYFCIKLMMELVKKSRYQYFGYYCAAVGAVSLLVYMISGK